MNSVRRKYSLVKLAMDITFAKRRQFITAEVHPIIDIQEHWPFLFSIKGISEEFFRLTEFDLKRVFLQNLSKYEDKLLRLPVLKMNV